MIPFHVTRILTVASPRGAILTSVGAVRGATLHKKTEPRLLQTDAQSKQLCFFTVLCCIKGMCPLLSKQTLDISVYLCTSPNILDTLIKVIMYVKSLLPYT